jgi:Raf kinase inhibitor-like YbhB/YbcL family protein
MTRLRAVLSALLLLLAAGCSDGDLGTVIDAARQAGLPNEDRSMRITSRAFEPGADIPRRFTCDGQDVSPPLAIEDIPPAAVSLVLVMDDPDAPGGTWDHWVAYDIPVVGVVEEAVGQLGTAGRNSWGRTGYGGPCPPRGSHRYIFTVYALDTRLGLPAGAQKPRVQDALKGHVLDRAQLVGRYRRAGG